MKYTSQKTRSKATAKILPFGAARFSVFGYKIGPVFYMCVALIILLFSAIQPQKTSSIRMALSDIFAPILSTVNTPLRYAADYTRSITGLANLQSENARLMKENLALKAWHQAAINLDAENKSLKKLLNIELAPDHNYISSYIIADNGNDYARSLLIKAGTEQGIEKGQAVLSGEGVIGRTIDTGKRTAQVLLLTDINSKIPVLIQDHEIKDILSGDNTSTPYLRHTEVSNKTIEGARVITSGHGGMFPYGLPVGTIVLENNIYRVKPYTDIRNIHFVRVIDTSKTTE